MDLCSPTQNPKPNKELWQAPTSNTICMQQFIYKLFFDLASTYFTHCRKFFKKFIFLASPKTRVVTGPDLPSRLVESLRVRR